MRFNVSWIVWLAAAMLRRLIAELTPPVVFRPAQRLYHRYCRVTPRAMFEGSYPSLEAVPCGPSRYNDDELAALSAAPTLEWLRSAGSPKINQTARHMFLPLMVSEFVDDPVTVLDLGGSGCVGLTEILDNVPRLDLATFRYVNVDTSNMCRFTREPVEAILRSKFNTASFVTITEDIPNSLGAPAVVNAASSLQYLSDYRSVLSRLAQLAPRAFIISFTPVSDHPTYACQQIHHGRQLALRVFNRAELISDMDRLGYRVSFVADHAMELTFKDMPGPFSLASMVFRPNRTTSNAVLARGRSNNEPVLLGSDS